jgi:hypothetical protein
MNTEGKSASRKSFSHSGHGGGWKFFSKFNIDTLKRVLSYTLNTGKNNVSGINRR